MDTELLFGDGVTVADLNDDALGRALDILHDADIESLYRKLALSTLEKLKLMNSFDGFIPIHSDTTSLSLYGEYRDQEDLEIVRGYSKDHRLDLKQIVFGLSIVCGIPIYGNVNKGNQDDPTWNLHTIAKLAGLVAEGDKDSVIYVADAAAVTQDNLKAFDENKTHFISRLPTTFRLCEQVKRAAWEKEEDAWINLGQLTDAKGSATYKIQAFRRELYGRTYRLKYVAVLDDEGGAFAGLGRPCVEVWCTEPVDLLDESVTVAIFEIRRQQCPLSIKKCRM